MNPNLNTFRQRYLQAVTRRHFLQNSGYGLGGLALAQLMGNTASAEPRPVTIENPLEPKAPPLPAKAKRVIYLHMAGSPPQQELFDYKPKLVEQNMQ
ncbi:MAG TPA: twin-arginine translocation signal domain-containing protein, partial [Planctomycetaceae bacterium]|nr:twin-arginine translocation signal domain-containing protein [Planctomycetaceae bacterium]